MAKSKKQRMKALQPAYAFAYLQFAGKFGLPKQNMKSELEKIILAVGKMDIKKELKSDNGEIDEFIGERDYEKLFDEAKKLGVKWEYISKAAYQVVRGILECDWSFLNSEELENIQKKYLISDKRMQKALMEYYHKEFK